MTASQYLQRHKEPNARRVLENYLEAYGNHEAILLRVPARINLLGTHIEHRGGAVNYLTIDRELWCVAGRRDDEIVLLHNGDPAYTPREIHPAREFPSEHVEWRKFIRTHTPKSGDWVSYVRASLFYLRNEFPGKPFAGMNLSFFGDIPVGAGLSSSSTVVVSSLLAACAVNNLDLPKERLVMMCGEAEWYVGTRGGSGDHAAILYGKKNTIAHTRFFPFSVEYLPFPDDHAVICCDSRVKAKKTEKARHIFNERITSYEIGFHLLRQNLPGNEAIRYLRDINPENIGGHAEIYRLLRTLPESLSRRESQRRIAGRDDIAVLFDSHDEPPDGYRLRDVVLYGIAECERSRRTREFLSTGRIADFGSYMNISHDGDRTVTHGNDGAAAPWEYRVTGELLQSLIADAEGSNPARKNQATLCRQPGAYRCSTPELDFIVDLVKQQPGVKGAKLTGAGLGGCVLVLVEKEHTEEIIGLLEERYYRPRGLKPAAFVCNSVDGAEMKSG